MNVVRTSLWQCEPTVAAFNIDLAAWTSVETLLVKDLTPGDVDRKKLRVHSLAGEDVSYVTCIVNARGTIVEFMEPNAMTDAMAHALERFIHHCLDRAERAHLVRPEVGFRPPRS